MVYSVDAKRDELLKAMLQLKEAARATASSIGGFNQATMDLQQAVKVLRAGIDKFDTKS